jgi:transcriptional regulator GlxA family with amidase domain
MELTNMKLGIPVYEGVNLLDVAGPYEMFSWVNTGLGLESIIVSADGGPVTTLNRIRFDAHASFAATPSLDVLWVPGGDPDALKKIMSDPASPYLAYLKKVAATAKWVCSVCEGALLLARAGLLDGYSATTHWYFIDCLKAFDKIDVDTEHQRYVLSGNRLTGGGISSGLDEALMLIQLLFGTKTALDVQRTTQYFPRPPVSGSIPADIPECPFDWCHKPCTP